MTSEQAVDLCFKLIRKNGKASKVFLRDCCEYEGAVGYWVADDAIDELLALKAIKVAVHAGLNTLYHPLR